MEWAVSERSTMYTTYYTLYIESLFCVMIKLYIAGEFMFLIKSNPFSGWVLLLLNEGWKMVNNAKGTNTHTHTYTNISIFLIKRKSHTNVCGY